MCALRMEAPVVAGVVGVKPESSLGFRLKFDEAGSRSERRSQSARHAVGHRSP